MHNFKNYDSHLLLTSAKIASDSPVKIIPNSSEKFLALITSEVTYIDSCMFLSESLDTLVENLKKDQLNVSKNLQCLFDYLGPTAANDLLRKGVYPYEYFNSFKKFKNKTFPTRKDFYNSIRGVKVSKDDYQYAKRVYKKYCKNLGDYHDLYLVSDTLLLASCFESFRNIALKNYRLDPVHYFSLAGYAWDSALLFTGE